MFWPSNSSSNLQRTVNKSKIKSYNEKLFTCNYGDLIKK